MRTTLTLFTLLSWLFARVPFGIRAQTTNAVCMDTFSWASNSLHQNPCEVASYLLGQCTANVHVDALPPGSHYGGPTTVLGSNPCQCNTVTFSLLGACGSCQNRTTEAWSVYSAHCPHVYSNEFPAELPDIPIPGWAFLDVKATDGFDVGLAENNANLTEITKPKPASSTNGLLSSLSSSPTLSLVAISSDVPTSTASVIPDKEEPPSAAKYTAGETRAIIGGIVGGTCAAMLLLLGAFIFQRRRQKRTQSTAALVGGGSESDIAQSSNLSGTSLPTKETA